MQINISLDDLRKGKLMVATPMYGGQCHGSFTKSMMDLTALCMNHQIQMVPYFLFNESLITRARNYCCDEFMRSNCTHLLFIDSDIGFNPNDALALMALSLQNADYHIIGGPYPKKCISWEKIKLAVDKGVADQNPNVLENFVGDYVFNPKNNTSAIPLNEPVEVLEIGTGFMLISRFAFEKFNSTYPQFAYRPDHVRTEHFDGSRKIMQYFQAEIDVKSERYLSEDYWFCQKAQQAEIKTWFCPWMRLQHSGSYIFAGSLADLASIGASATANPGELGGKNKQVLPPIAPTSAPVEQKIRSVRRNKK